MQLPQVLTSPRAWSIHVEWQWPENSGEHSRLEMQYLNADGRLQRQVIAWPLAGVLIGGLKAGERLQIRLRPIDKNGAVREWTQGDWIEGVSSSNADEYLAALSITAGSDMRLMKTFSASQFKIISGEVFLTDAFIKDSIESAKISSPPTLSSLAKQDGETTADDLIKATLSEVLSRVLPMAPAHKAKDVAINAAKAIYAAFASLEKENASPRKTPL